MSNRLVNNHCQQDVTKDQKRAIVIFEQWQGAFIRPGRERTPPPQCLPASLPPFCLHPSLFWQKGSLLQCRGEPRDHLSQSADYRHSLAGPVLLRRARVLVGPQRLLHCLGPPAIPTSRPLLYCVQMFDRHRAHNNLFPAGTCTICLADPTNSFNPFSLSLVFAAVAHRRHLINAGSLFISTSCSLFDPSLLLS